MLSVSISINASPILARSARNQGITNKKGETLYHLDDGSKIWHNKSDGAVKLAIKMLKTIKKF
jgi:hypothetical protein